MTGSVEGHKSETERDLEEKAALNTVVYGLWETYRK